MHANDKVSCYLHITETIQQILHVFLNYFGTVLVTHSPLFVIDHDFIVLYYTGCLLIEFNMPQIEIKASHFKQLKAVMQKSSAALGFIVSLGNQFEDSSHDDIDKEIAPKLKAIFS